jgi:hypothetical protein
MKIYVNKLKQVLKVKKIGDVYIEKVCNEKYKRFLYYCRILYSIISHSKATSSKINKIYRAPIHHKLRFTPKAYTLITNYNLEWSGILIYANSNSINYLVVIIIHIIKKLVIFP